MILEESDDSEHESEVQPKPVLSFAEALVHVDALIIYYARSP